MKPKFEEIDLTNHNNKKTNGRYKNSMPYTMIWLHSPKGSYLIKGYAHTVDEYIDKHFPINLHHKKYFGPLREEHQCGWHFDGVRCFIEEKGKKGVYTDIHRKKHTFFIHLRKSKQLERKTVLELNRIPNKWIPEYDNIIIMLNNLQQYT